MVEEKEPYKTLLALIFYPYRNRTARVALKANDAAWWILLFPVSGTTSPVSRLLGPCW